MRSKWKIAVAIVVALGVSIAGMSYASAATKAKTYTRGDSQFCADGLGRGYLSEAKGSSGNCVRVLQQALNAVAKSDLEVDGDFGPDTDKALRAYEESKDWNPDGKADGGFTNGGLFKYFVALDTYREKNPKSGEARLFKSGAATITGVVTNKPTKPKPGTKPTTKEEAEENLKAANAKFEKATDALEKAWDDLAESQNEAKRAQAELEKKRLAFIKAREEKKAAEEAAAEFDDTTSNSTN